LEFGTLAGTASVVVGEPTVEIDEYIDVTDTSVGALGTVCAGESPATFVYSVYVGPFAEPQECGDQYVMNTAARVTNDTGATA
jgi:hypothetical protein